MSNPTLQKESAAAMLVELYETLGDFQFEHRRISGADLVDYLGEWMRNNLQAYRTLCTGEPQAGLGALKTFFACFRDLYEGSGSVNGADLVESVDEWLSRTYAAMPVIVRGPFTAQVASSADGASFWSERDGWGELNDATAFFLQPPKGLAGADSDEWRAVSLEEALLADAQRWVEEGAEAEAPRG